MASFNLYPIGTKTDLTKITVADSVVHTMAEGLGFNWHACFEPKTYPAPEDEARWGRIFGHAKWLNMRFVRFIQLGSAICDKTGNFAPGHASFDQLRRLNAWAERFGATILLDPFVIPSPHQYKPWPGAPTAWGNKGKYHLGVKDPDAYVSRFVVPYLRFVVEQMGCRAVTWFNHVNEPLRGGVAATPSGIDDHVRYVETLAAVRQGLDEAGLGRIGNMGPDTHTLQYWPIPHMLEMGADPDPHIQAYCMHQYHSHFDWDTPSNALAGTNPMSETIDRQLLPCCQYAHRHGKPFFLTELGMFHYGWEHGDPAGIARHDNTILEAEFITRALGAGVDAVLRWAWLNPGDLDGWWQLVQTTDGSDAPVRDPYATYGTLLRAVDRGARLLRVKIKSPAVPRTVHAAAVANTDGSRSLMVINDDYSNCAAVSIAFPVGGATAIQKIVTDPVRKYQHGEELPCSDGWMETVDSLSPMSLTVYTSKAI
jgi:hypothetical protein